MYCALLFLALVASVTGNQPTSSPTDFYNDVSAPEVFPQPDNNSTRWRHVSVDITIDLTSMLASNGADEGFIAVESGLADSEWYSCSYQLLAATGVTVLLAVLITVEVYSLYLKRRRMMDSGMVQVKNTV